VLAPYLRTARVLIETLESQSVGFTVELVGDQEDALMKAVHGRSREAIRVVKRADEWPVPSGDIPF